MVLNMERAQTQNPFGNPVGILHRLLKLKKLVEEYGVNSFRAEVRKIFSNPDQALRYEYKFLKKVKALKKNDWLK